LREQLSLLIELQKAESEIGRINLKCRILPEEIAKLDETFKRFQLSVEENRRNFEDIQKSHREREEKLKKGQETLKRTRERLGEVKTNKEYQAVLKEIEGVEKKNSETEDEIISLLEKTDRLKEELRIKEKEMASYERQYGGGKNKLEEELRSMDKILLECQQKGYELKKRIADHLLKKYDAIKSLNNGLAVVPVWKEVCEGCHMKIPAQLYNEVQKLIELYACPNCNRIIYWHDHSGDES
jgi:predicted  nucleic acid-binding Zn-ribbon protein